MPEMEAIISVRYRVPLDTKVPDAEFVSALPNTEDGPGLPPERMPMVMENEKTVEKARRQAAKDAEKLAKEMKDGQDDVLDVLVEEVREA
jgi:hypothetical protein